MKFTFFSKTDSFSKNSLIFLFSQTENFSQENSMRKNKRTTEGFDKVNSPNGQMFLRQLGKSKESIISKKVSERSAKIVFLDM